MEADYLRVRLLHQCAGLPARSYASTSSWGAEISDTVASPFHRTAYGIRALAEAVREDLRLIGQVECRVAKWKMETSLRSHGRTAEATSGLD